MIRPRSINQVVQERSLTCQQKQVLRVHGWNSGLMSPTVTISHLTLEEHNISGSQSPISKPNCLDYIFYEALKDLEAWTRNERVMTPIEK